MTEEQLQNKCTVWFWNSFPLWRRMLFHVDNNSYNAIIGARKKALGVVKGPSDLVFVGFYQVVFIEMKNPGEKQKPEQIDFMDKVMSRGHMYVVISDFETFKSLICKLIVTET